ncbi:MAG: hypothetical protein KJ711_05240, partial [Candidatus Omnitrophica bacterium]|nr:hypothetical protein [Candidatus Omnitrophota bacterium]MBU1524638.1 hypothetical protein [Candidatus Omnitrophota bacterium]
IIKDADKSLQNNLTEYAFPELFRLSANRSDEEIIDRLKDIVKKQDDQSPKLSASSAITTDDRSSITDNPDGLCLTPDSLIHLADGTTKPLIEIKPGDMVLSLNLPLNTYDLRLFKIEPHRVNALLDMGVKPVYRITTKSGKTLKTTLNHPYLTKQGWRKLKDIKVGEEIVVLKNNFTYDEGGADDVSLLYQGLTLLEKRPLNQQLRCSFLYSSLLSLQNINPTKIKTKMVRDQSSFDFKFNLKKISPAANPKARILANSIDRLESSFSLERVNINLSFPFRQNCIFTLPYRVNPVKQNKIDVVCEPIISIEPLGNLHVYDIEVEGTHNFVAEGIVAHNTFISPQDSGLRDKKQSISSIEGNKGGIDLNPKNLEIDVRGESIDLPKLNIPFDIQNFQGFTFHIIKIEVIKDLNSVLNIPEREPKEKRKHLSSYKDRSKAFCSLK